MPQRAGTQSLKGLAMFGTCVNRRAAVQERPNRLDVPVLSCTVKRCCACEYTRS